MTVAFSFDVSPDVVSRINKVTNLLYFTSYVTIQFAGMIDRTISQPTSLVMHTDCGDVYTLSDASRCLEPLHSFNSRVEENVLNTELVHKAVDTLKNMSIAVHAVMDKTSTFLDSFNNQYSVRVVSIGEGIHVENVTGCYSNNIIVLVKADHAGGATITVKSKNEKNVLSSSRRMRDFFLSQVPDKKEAACEIYPTFSSDPPKPAWVCQKQ
jgi:hypothetical protein